LTIKAPAATAVFGTSGSRALSAVAHVVQDKLADGLAVLVSGRHEGGRLKTTSAEASLPPETGTSTDRSLSSSRPHGTSVRQGQRGLRRDHRAGLAIDAAIKTGRKAQFTIDSDFLRACFGAVETEKHKHNAAVPLFGRADKP